MLVRIIDMVIQKIAYLLNKVEHNVIDYVKNPILIKNSYNYENISEKIITEVTSFMKELGQGFCFIDNEYKI